MAHFTKRNLAGHPGKWKRFEGWQGLAKFLFKFQKELTDQLSKPAQVATEHADKALVCAKANRGYFVASDWLNPFQDAYEAELINWINSLQGKGSFRGATAWDGYVTMMVTAACIQSLNTAAVVPVKLIEKPALDK